MTSVQEVADTVLRVCGAVGLPSIFLYLVRDKKIKQAEAKKAGSEAVVSERTVETKVKSAEVGQIEAHMIAVEHAIDMERKAKNEQIESLKEQLAEAREETATLKTEIADLRTELRELKSNLRNRKRET